PGSVGRRVAERAAAEQRSTSPKAYFTRLFHGRLGRLDRGKGGHVQDSPDTGRGLKDMSGLSSSQQDRADSNTVSGSHLNKVVGDIGCIDARHDQEIGLMPQSRTGSNLTEQGQR